MKCNVTLSINAEIINTSNVGNVNKDVSALKTCEYNEVYRKLV